MSALGDVPSDINPMTALLLEVARAAGAVEWFDAQVRDLTPDDLNHHIEIVVGEGKDGEKYEVHWPAQNLVQMWNTQRAMLAKITGDAVRLGLAERGIRIREAEAAMLFTLLMAVLQDPALGLSAPQMDTARSLLATKLRAIDTTALEEVG